MKAEKMYDPIAVEQQEWKKRQLKERLKKMLTIASPIFIIILWELCSRTGLLDARFFSTANRYRGNIGRHGDKW